jgi:hypothetical protein
MVTKTPVRRPSRKLSDEDAAMIKKMLREGAYQHQIAAAFETNAGRISEINTGKLFPGVRPAP